MGAFRRRAAFQLVVLCHCGVLPCGLWPFPCGCWLVSCFASSCQNVVTAHARKHRWVWVTVLQPGSILLSGWCYPLVAHGDGVERAVTAAAMHCTEAERKAKRRDLGLKLLFILQCSKLALHSVDVWDWSSLLPLSLTFTVKSTRFQVPCLFWALLQCWGAASADMSAKLWFCFFLAQPR